MPNKVWLLFTCTQLLYTQRNLVESFSWQNKLSLSQKNWFRPKKSIPLFCTQIRYGKWKFRRAKDVHKDLRICLETLIWLCPPRYYWLYQECSFRIPPPPCNKTCTKPRPETISAENFCQCFIAKNLNYVPMHSYTVFFILLYTCRLTQFTL